MTELKILYITENTEDDIAYFYDSCDKILLPIETTNENEFTSGLGYVVKTLCGLLNNSCPTLEIYRYQDNKFYSYINVKNKKKTFKINCEPKLLANLAKSNNWPVFTNKKILTKHGIKIDEEMYNDLVV